MEFVAKMRILTKNCNILHKLPALIAVQLTVDVAQLSMLIALYDSGLLSSITFVAQKFPLILPHKVLYFNHVYKHTRITPHIQKFMKKYENFTWN